MTAETKPEFRETLLKNLRVPPYKIGDITNLGEPELLRISEKGYFPAPVDGLYKVVETFIGILKYEREKSSTRSMKFKSMLQCSQHTGTPFHALQGAKRKGCPAFQTNGSMDFNEFQAWSYKQQSGGEEILDLNSERALLAREQRIEKERENALAKGEITTVSEVEQLVWENGLLPLKSALEAMPESLAPLVSPDNAARAKSVLRDWVEKMKKNIRQAMKGKFE